MIENLSFLLARSLECCLQTKRECLSDWVRTTPCTLTAVGVDFRVNRNLAATLVKQAEVVGAEIEAELLNHSLASEHLWQCVAQSHVLQAQVRHVNDVA